MQLFDMALTAEEISNLLVPFLGGAQLSLSQLKSFEIYLDVLLRWNAKINLTAVRDQKDIVTRHFGESLFAARHLFPHLTEESVVDLGSGAGFPGIPLNIWNHRARLTLIESNHRKATFLREVARTLKLEGVLIEAERAENISAKADLVTMRAVERFADTLPIAAGLVRPSGRVALLIGEAQIELAKSTLTAVNWQNPTPIPLSRERTLLIGNFR